MSAAFWTVRAKPATHFATETYKEASARITESAAIFEVFATRRGRDQSCYASDLLRASACSALNAILPSLVQTLRARSPSSLLSLSIIQIIAP